jgi:putative holliday junction resolvase
MRVLGLDLGEHWIGVALSDETATIAGGLPTLRSVGAKKDVAAVVALAQEHEVGEIVVGLPRRMDGSVGPAAQKALDFIDKLRARLALPIVPWDERLTTVAAQRLLVEADVSRRGRKAVVDKVAAILILQNYLDYHKTAAAEASRDSD